MLVWWTHCKTALVGRHSVGMVDPLQDSISRQAYRPTARQLVVGMVDPLVGRHRVGMVDPLQDSISRQV